MNFVKKITGVAISNHQLRYLPQSVQLEEAVNPHLIRLTMLVISGAIMVFILWASLTNIREVSRTSGEIVPEGFVQVVQHLHGGIITEIKVDDGALVEKGDSLLKVNDGSAQQDLAQAVTRRNALRIKALRLGALVNNTPLNLSSLNIQNNDNEIKVAEMQLKQERDNLKNIKANLKTKEDNLAISKKSLAAREKAYKEGYVSKIEFMKVQHTLNEAESNLATAKSKLAQFTSTAYKELEETEDLISQDNELITKLEQRVKWLDVIAPVRGLVKGLNINTLGSVIKPGQILMEIVPLDKPLIARVKVSPRDIGHVQLGQEVRVKISAYDFSRYGSIKGKVAFISATTFEDEGKQYYIGRITLEKNHVGEDSNKNIVMPGMTTEADILTGNKSVLAYLFRPISNSLQTALTER